MSLPSLGAAATGRKTARAECHGFGGDSEGGRMLPSGSGVPAHDQNERDIRAAVTAFQRNADHVAPNEELLNCIPTSNGL